MRFLIVAGEESGEIYGARLMRELKAAVPGASFAGIGGDRMAAEGLRVIRHCREMASIGLVQMLEKIGFFVGVLNGLRGSIRAGEYDAVILIDYPDFNLRVARAAHKAGVPVFYYACPQFWAWRSYRIGAVKKWVDAMFVLFPFEEKLYRGTGMEAHFLGHPMLDEIASPGRERSALRAELLTPGCSTLVGLMPGSRNSEVEKMLPPLLATADLIGGEMPEVSFVIPAAGHISPAGIRAAVGGRRKVKVLEGRSHDVMAACDYLITKSGTSTIEAAMFGAPMSIVYRTNVLNYLLAKSLAHVKYAGLPNLVAGREVAREFLQGDFVPSAVARHVADTLMDPARLERTRADMAEVRRQLGAPGAAMRASEMIAEMLKKGKK